jgi:pimeloyl-ACP methyl ester carboxylesterase
MAQVHFEESGKGKPVILLHGFPMDSTTWTDFAAQLSSDFHVITPDLPGFGKSEILPLPFTIDQVAEVLLGWIEEHQWKDVFLIGHSLGGYVALAMVEKKPSLFRGLGLFHSTAYADNAEKKESRTKVLKFVDEQGVKAFTSNFIQPLFVNSEHAAIPFVRSITTKATAEAVKGYTTAMRDRPDRTHVLRDFSGPVLFIAGKSDAGIPFHTVMDQARLCAHPTVHVLEDVAHMGMFEKSVETLTIVRSILSGN